MTEHYHQAAVFEWAAMLRNRYPILGNLFSIPNSGKRSVGAAMFYKAEGLKSGVPDMFLAAARNGKNGLFIELKTKTGKLSGNQYEWMIHLQNAGYKVELCRGADEAIKTISEYLGITDGK